MLDFKASDDLCTRFLEIHLRLASSFYARPILFTDSLTNSLGNPAFGTHNPLFRAQGNWLLRHSHNRCSKFRATN